MLAKWFRLKSGIRRAIVYPGFVAVGFGLDTIDHALGWKRPILPFFVTAPLQVILMLFLLRDPPIAALTGAAGQSSSAQVGPVDEHR